MVENWEEAGVQSGSRIEFLVTPHSVHASLGMNRMSRLQDYNEDGEDLKVQEFLIPMLSIDDAEARN